MSTKTYDVIVVGAGPVGLFLACELRLAGDISVLLVERDADPSDMSNPWKAAPLGLRGLNTPSAETFYRRGLLDQVLGEDMFIKRTNEFDVNSKTAGHFAGLMFDPSKVDTSAPCWKYKLPGPAFCPAPSSLGKVGAALYKRAIELGVEFRGGVEVNGIHQDDDGEEVVLTATGDQSFRARWLVGCDGGRSKVRKATGFEFAGTEPGLMGYTVLCDLDDPQSRFQRGFHRTSTGIYMQLFPGHIAFMEAVTGGEKLDRATEHSKEELEAIMRRITGFEDVCIKTVKLYSTFTDRARQATTYRKGRVLLAGDSAHIHAPLGGQGMNVGIGDAINLGWKLAAVVKGDVSPDLLDTYTSERHPIGAWVTDWSRAQVATLKPDPQGVAVANVIRDLISTRDGVTHMVDRFWGLTQRYDLSQSDDLKPPHPIVGLSVPDFEFDDGSGRLGEKMRSGRGILLSFEDAETAQLKSLVEKWSPAVELVSGHAVNELSFKALLVRPDGTVAWAATEDEIDGEAVTSALTRWFGSRA